MTAIADVSLKMYLIRNLNCLGSKCLDRYSRTAWATGQLVYGGAIGSFVSLQVIVHTTHSCPVAKRNVFVLFYSQLITNRSIWNVQAEIY